MLLRTSSLRPHRCCRSAAPAGQSPQKFRPGRPPQRGLSPAAELPAPLGMPGRSDDSRSVGTSSPAHYCDGLRWPPQAHRPRRRVFRTEPGLTSGQSGPPVSGRRARVKAQAGSALGCARALAGSRARSADVKKRRAGGFHAAQPSPRTPQAEAPSNARNADGPAAATYSTSMCSPKTALPRLPQVLPPAAQGRTMSLQDSSPDYPCNRK